jgi:hypothetical protein
VYQNHASLYFLLCYICVIEYDTSGYQALIFDHFRLYTESTSFTTSPSVEFLKPSRSLPFALARFMRFTSPSFHRSGRKPSVPNQGFVSQLHSCSVFQIRGDMCRAT